MRKRCTTTIDEELFKNVYECKRNNPNLIQPEIGKLYDITAQMVGQILIAREVAVNEDIEYLNSLSPESRADRVKKVQMWRKILGMKPLQLEEEKPVITTKKEEPKTEAATHTAKVLCKTPEKPSATQNEAMFYAKVLQSVQCIPELLNAIQNLSEKLTVLNQRLYTPMNEMSHNLADVADTQQKVVQKLDRVAKSVSVFTDEGGKTPVTVYDAIESGFNDVCGKLDTVRYKLEKAVK